MRQVGAALIGSLVLAWTLPAVAAPTPAAETPSAIADPVALADPFVGADAGGNTVPGAGVPFGFVSLSPDTTQAPTSGYDSASAIMGFSFTHVSGTGGRSKYGNFRITPTVGEIGVRNLVFARSGEAASPGYYRVTIGPGIGVEATATGLAGLLRVTYPATATSNNLVLDATAAIPLLGEGQRATAVHVEAVDSTTVQGWASFEGGWNPAPYTLYFHARYDRPAVAFGTWQARQGETTLQTGPASIDGASQAKSPAARLGLMTEYDTAMEFAHRTGTWARFAGGAGPVQVKLAVSFISMAKARANLEAQMPDWDFDRVRAAAAASWRDALGRIEVSGGTDEQRRIFYSALYRSHTMPHDLSGENVWWASAEPHYEDFYTIWDTFRTLHPLLTLIQPERQRGMVRSLLDTYRHTGWLPDGRIAGANGMTQGGSNADVVVADAVLKDLGGIDTALAWEALTKDAEVESDAPFLQGRVLQDWHTLGYVSLSQPRSASRTLEYAFNDFAIAGVAARLGKDAAAARYRKRSEGWARLWDPQLGCIRPRYADGRWLENFTCEYLYPDKSQPWWEHPFYEGSSRQYSTYVPHDVPGLIARTGGPAGFVAWLDTLFDTGQYEQGNEPDILAPWLYIDAGRPDRTADRVRTILASRYHRARDGLPGNDDAGAMSSWYVWSSIGLYPVAGTVKYYIGSPLFTRSVIHLARGRSFTVAAPQTSDRNRYVVAARLNGKPLGRATLTHAEIAQGGLLELDMAAVPNAWP
ncbi:MAG TPA: GH92 family glycosyl hydrolase, partial [Novosphingobium sp.]